MKPVLKAIVFRTARLKETKIFFESLGLPPVESSPTHFLIYSNHLRVLFMASEEDFGVEVYLCDKTKENLTILKDPNQIKIILS
jgi:hypothetical protein